MIRCVNLDETTVRLCDDYGKKYGLSRSAVIRLAVNTFLKEVS